MNTQTTKTKIILAVMLWLVGWAAPTNTAHALPQDGTVAAGGSTITQPDGSTMHINQTTDKSIINWQGYSIGTNEAVRYFQPNSGSISLNRVTGADPSLIYGQLSANGQVWVINPNGLLIGQNAQINVGGFLASTLNITDSNFINGNYNFTGASTSLTSITNQGNINAADGGYVVFISPTITNSGNITANNGSVNMASGDDVTLTFANNGLINLVINKQAAADALGIDNSGTITADGGQVIISAQAAGDLLKTVINNTGVIQARTISNQNGVIKLLGGMENNNIVNVGGTLDASAPNGGDGGFIETSAASVQVTDGAIITTAAPNGKTGEWLIDPTDYNIAASGGDITGATLSTNLGTTSVTILSSDGAGGTNGDVNVNDAVSWNANNTLTLSAYRDVNVNSNITATGNTAGLTLTPSNTGAGGSYYLNNGAVITLSGSAPSLTIAGNAYTVINDVTALQNMSGNLAGYYAIGSNIDASATASWNWNGSIYNGFAPVGNYGGNDSTPNFAGTFDGLGHTITGLTINRPAANYVGLFGYTNGATISNVGLVGGSVSGEYYVGGLAGVNSGGTITNSYSTASVTGAGNEIGGLVGSSGSSITNSYSTGSVSGNDSVGGLVGYNGSTITNSYSTGSVNGGNGVGGLVGWSNQGTITQSYSTGSVTGGNTVGGLVGGSNSLSTITNSYSTGAVTGTTDVGGLLGWNQGTINNSYWDTETSGLSQGYGTNLGTFSAIGLTTAQMMQQANFSGWDFTNTWWMSEDNTRPILRMEYSTTITNAHQLQLMALDLGAIYTLAADIDMAELSQASGLWNITTGFVPVGDSTTNFTGAFDGLGHTISGLTINRPATDFVGLFGYTLGGGAVIRNVGLVGGSVTGNNYVGGLVGFDGGTITDSYSTGAVSGTALYVGGLAGWNDGGGTITNSYSTGAVAGGSYYIGGLVGVNYNSTITNSYSTGAVTGAAGSQYVGGLVGVNYATITDSYSTGAVTGAAGSYYVGGLVGRNDGGGTITDSYSTGAVTGTNYVGGLVGLNYATITNSYWDTQTSGQATSDGGTGLTTAQMMQQANFTGWDFTNTWCIYEGYTYPLLKSFLTPLTVTANADSKTYDGLAYSEGNGVFYSIASPTLSGALAYSGTSQGAVSAGSYVITPGGQTSGNYTITFANGALTVNTAPLTVTADADSKTYDGLAYTDGNGVDYSGFVNGETSAVLGGTLDYSGTSQGAINAGSYVITPGGQTSGNYTITFANGALTVTPAALTVTADADIKTYDGLAYTGGNGVGYSGFVNGETSAVLGGTLDYSGTSQGAVNAGSYVITPGGQTSGNYTITFANGALTVTPAALTITANADSKTYNGLAYTGDNGVAYTGFVNSETSSVLGGALAYSGTSQGAINAGGYVITPGGLTSGNYTISYNNSALTVTPAALTITANADSKTYNGLAYTGGNGVAYTGFVNSETSSVLGGALNYGGTSQGAINAGGYLITPSGLTSGNYTITYANGVLTITAAPTPTPTPTTTTTGETTTPTTTAATDVVDYTNVIQEGLGGIISGVAGTKQTKQTAESPVFTFTAGGLLRPLITYYRPTKEDSGHLCLIMKKNGNPAIVDCK